MLRSNEGPKSLQEHYFILSGILSLLVRLLSQCTHTGSVMIAPYFAFCACLFSCFLCAFFAFALVLMHAFPPHLEF